MITQVFTDALQVVHDIDAKFLQACCLSDPGNFQKLRRVDGAGANDDFAIGLRFTHLTTKIVTHAGTTLASEDKTLGQCIRLNVQIGAAARRIEIAIGRAHTAALADRCLRHADAFLARAVVVICIVNPDFGGGGDNLVVDLTLLNILGDLERSVAAPIFIVALALIALHLLKDRQDVLIAPTAVAQLRPSVVVERLAAHEDHAVDRTRATEQLAARHGDAPAA